MNGRFNDFEIYGSDDLMRMKSIGAQLSSAREVAEWSAQNQKRKSSVEASKREHERVAKERERLETLRYQTENAALRESFRLEAIRHKESRLFNIVFALIAIVSLIIAIFK